MVKKWGQRIYLAAIFLFLYLPILVLIVLSFNNSKSRVVWGGFTLKWYASCFTDETIMNAFVTTLQVTLTAAIISTVIGTLAAIGISAMKRKNRSIMLGATPMYAFYKVTWPEIKSGVFSGFLMAVTMSLDDFSITFFTKGARRQHPVDDALHGAAQGSAPGIVRPVNHFVFVCISSASCHEPPFGQNRRELCRYPLKEVPLTYETIPLCTDYRRVCRPASLGVRQRGYRYRRQLRRQFPRRVKLRQISGCFRHQNV